MRCRILVVYRVEPGVASRLLPEGLSPRLVQGRAVGLVCYTRLGTLRSRFLPRQGAALDHLAYRFAVEREGSTGSEEGTWVQHRETSSWLAGRLGERFVRGEYGRSRFQLQEQAFGLELRVESERGEELYLRAEACGAPTGSMFSRPQELEGFLDASGAVRPLDVFAPEADQIDLNEGFAPEPLSVFELRAPFFEDERHFPPGTAVLDSAWRLVTRRAQPVHERSTARLQPMLEAGEAAAPAL